MKNFSTQEQKENELEQPDQQQATCSVNDTFEKCTCCDEKIRYGNAIVEMERIVLQMDLDNDGSRLVATVIDSSSLATICFECGNKNFMPGKLRGQLAEKLGLNPPEPYMVHPFSETITDNPLDPCVRCGCEIKPGNAQVDLSMMVAQVDWSEAHDDSLLTPIYAESLLTFCASCGNQMSEKRLDDALKQVLVYKDRQHEDEDWDFDDLYDDEEDSDIDDEADKAKPVLAYYSKQSLPGLTASFGNIPDALKYVTEILIPAGHDYIVNIRGGWEIEADKPICMQVVSANRITDNKKLGLTLHIAFDPEYDTTDSFIRFMETTFFRHFERYTWDGVPCFNFYCGTDVEKLNRIARLLLVEVFRYTTVANIECNLFDQGVLNTQKNLDCGAETPTENANQKEENTILDVVVTTCDYCGVDIMEGNACVKFNRGIQQLLQPEPTGGFEKILIDKDVMGVVCASCGNMFQDLQDMRKKLNDFLELEKVRVYPPAGTSKIPESSENDICDDCGREIGEGNTELVIEKSVIQLSDKIGNYDKTISCNELLSFCAWCAAGKHTRSYVRNAVQEMIDEIGTTETVYRKMRESNSEHKETREHEATAGT